jgi:NAD(P)-dependent dehydrogenase (short-subunit alcohol dehydrogenase family)
VTGGGRGIGKAIAFAFAREKAYVVLNDIGPQNELHTLMAKLSDLGVQSLTIQANVSQANQVREMIRQSKS